MIVVSDTSPINYLILIELQDLLPKLLDRILIPKLYIASCNPPRRRIRSNGSLPKPRIGWRFDHRRKSIPPSESSIQANERSFRWRCRSGPNLCYWMNGRVVRPPENGDSGCLEHLV